MSVVVRSVVVRSDECGCEGGEECSGVGGEECGGEDHKE